MEIIIIFLIVKIIVTFLILGDRKQSRINQQRKQMRLARLNRIQGR